MAKKKGAKEDMKRDPFHSKMGDVAHIAEYKHKKTAPKPKEKTVGNAESVLKKGSARATRGKGRRQS